MHTRSSLPIELLCLDRLGSACCKLIGSSGANQILFETITSDPDRRPSQSCISDTSAAAARQPPNHSSVNGKGQALDQHSPTISSLRATKASYLRAGAAGKDMIEHRRSSSVPGPRHYRLPRPRQSSRQLSVAVVDPMQSPCKKRSKWLSLTRTRCDVHEDCQS